MKLISIIFILAFTATHIICDDSDDNMAPADPIAPPPSDDSIIFVDINSHTNIYNPMACSLDPPPTLSELEEFYAWADVYKKEYKSPRARRCATVKVVYHIREIAAYNKLYDAGQVSFKRALSFMSDLSHIEKKKQLAMKDVEKIPVTRQKPVKLPVLPEAIEYIDWNEEGFVGPVGSNWRCGSCYAWAGAAVLESQLRLCNISYESVSVQSMVDCPTNGVWGCQSGWPYYTFKWQETAGILPASKYPYRDTLTKCVYDPKDYIAKIEKSYRYDFTKVNGNASFIAQVVSHYGPVSVTFCVEDSLYQYFGGIYKNPKCCKDVEHLVTIVGYGTDPKEGDFWIVKNSWGENWGMDGFFMIERGKNTCGIENQVQFAEVRSLDGKVCKRFV